MTYLDLTPGELDRLSEFHKQHPKNTLRIYSDELVDFESKKYRKHVTDFNGNETDIADPTFD